MVTLFVADIGGTKSELAIVPLTGSDNRLLLQKRYTNADFKGVEEIMDYFFNSMEGDQIPQVACLAVAGLVGDGKAALTNLPWTINCHLLKKRFGFEQVILLNDLTAVARSLAMLLPADLLQIQAGCGQEGEVRGIVAPGTGLGEGLLVDLGGQLFAHGSEGGHTDFAPVDEEQLALLSWMQKKMRPVSYEMLISGPGLANLYDFCREYHQIPESAGIAEEMNGIKDRIPVIVGGAISDSPCPLCRRVIDLFLSILGSEAGNLALKLYARGGIYLGGGLLPRLVDHIEFAGFLKSFHAKGLMSGLMQDIPVNLILRKDAALIGALGYARQALKVRNADGR